MSDIQINSVNSWPPPPPLDIIWYDSPEAVHKELWRSAAEDEGMTVEDLIDQGEGVAFTDTGEEVSVSNEQMFDGMRLMGCWGWVDTEKNVIHAWADKDADPATVIHFLAHEIGHATGTPDPDGIQEEMRAEQFGHTASQAFKFFNERPQ